MKKSSTTSMTIYRFIMDFIEKNQYPPTVREIAEHVGLRSPSTVHRHLKTLQEQGLIEKSSHKQRAYTVNSMVGRKSESVPLLGRVAAGNPINALENIEEIMQLPDLLTSGLPKDEVFMLRVQGTSMKNAGILDGDIVVVAVGQNIHNGDIVIARIDDEDVTVKRIQQRNSVVVLIPDNEAFAPLIIPRNRVEIIGKVVGLMRPY